MDKESGNQENYRTEYKEVATNHRFYAGLRFIVIAFTATLQSALVALYSQIMQRVLVSEETGQSIPPQFYIIPIIGMVSMFATFVIERRNISLFRAMIRRGKELEFHLGLTSGQFGRLAEPELVRPKGVRKFFTHTWSIGLLYTAILVMWIYFFLVAFLGL